jgi:hypothetical protein
MLKSLLLVFIFLSIFIGSANAGTFYCIHDIPEFSKSESQKLADFGIKFRPYKFNSSIRKHTRSAARLVKDYGDNWRDTLQIRMTDSGEKVKLFLKYLTGNGGVDIRGKSVKLTYKRTGYITCVSTVKKLRGEGGSMIHRRITSQTYTIKGRKWNRESYVMQGSGCCFTKETKILMHDLSQKSIAELVIGDSIKTYNRTTNQLEYAAIKQYVNIRHENLYQLNFRDFKITTTADHPFLLESGWGAILPELAKKYINNESCSQIDLQAKFSMIVNGKLMHQKLESIEQFPQAQMTFTITELSQGDTFIANGLIVAVESLIVL